MARTRCGAQGDGLCFCDACVPDAPAGGPRPSRRVDFDRINRDARRSLPALLRRWLPGGCREGDEWVARNPNRHDRRPGSFKVNLATGRWADFATGDGGSDPVSLAAYLGNLSQHEAALRLAQMLGIDP